VPIPDEGCHLIHANVDFVFNGSLSSIPLKRQLDYIVASNVIEHVPDPIDFLVQSEKFLKPGGQLHLVVPDTRYCFDYYRELTSISQVIDRFGCSNSSLGVAADVVLNTCKKGESMAWGEGALGAIQLVNSIEQSLRDFDYFGNELKKGYVDLHNWVFTPSSFRLLINDLRLLGYVDFSEAYFMDTQGFEFIVGSSVDQNRPFIDRHSYLESSRSLSDYRLNRENWLPGDQIRRRCVNFRAA
jgi:SAM-dependent methyltransferase